MKMSDKKVFGVVKTVPCDGKNTYPYDEKIKVVMVRKNKDPSSYAQYAFYRFHSGDERIVFKCCGGAISSGLNAIAILSSIVGDIEVEDFKLSQHVDNEDKIHTKVSITLINPKSTSELNSEISLENLVTHFE